MLRSREGRFPLPMRNEIRGKDCMCSTDLEDTMYYSEAFMKPLKFPFTAGSKHWPC